MHFHLFSGGTIQCQSLQIPQAPARAGRGRGTGWHCRVPGQQAAGEEPGDSPKNHKWRVIHPNAKKWPKKCTKCENLCHSVLYLWFLQIKNLSTKNLCLFFTLRQFIFLGNKKQTNKQTFYLYLMEKNLVTKNKTWQEQPGQSSLGKTLNTIHGEAGEA